MEHDQDAKEAQKQSTEEAAVQDLGKTREDATKPAKRTDTQNNFSKDTSQQILLKIKSECRKDIERCVSRLNCLRRLLVDGLVIISIFLLIVIVCQELMTDSVLIEPFEVPKQLESQGYSGRVVAKMLVDKMHFIRERANTNDKWKFVTAWSQKQPEVSIPGSGITLSNVLLYLKKVVGQEPKRISGDIITITSSNKLYFIIRVDEMPAQTFSGSVDKIDDGMIQVAQYTYKHTEPITLALYLYHVDSQACLEIIQYLIQTNSPYRPTAFNLWGSILKERKDYAGAIVQFQKAVDLQPKFAGAYTNWGDALYKQADYKAAIEKYQKAVTIEPNEYYIYYQWGKALLDIRDYSGAIEKLKKAVNLAPQNANLIAFLSDALYRAGNYSEAIDKMQIAARLDPGYLLSLANMYFNWGADLFKNDHKEAADKFKKALEYNPKDPNIYYSLGILLYNSRDFSEANIKFQKAVALGLKDADVYINWGDSLYQLKDYENAVNKYLEALRLNSKDAYVYKSLGMAYEMLKDDKRAVDNYQKAVELNTKDYYPYYRLGFMLSKKGDDSNAISKYEQANKLKPKDATFYSNWGVSLYNQKDYQGAADKFQKAIEYDASYAQFYANLGSALQKLGKYSEAIQKYQQAVERDPKGEIADKAQKVIAELKNRMPN